MEGGRLKKKIAIPVGWSEEWDGEEEEEEEEEEEAHFTIAARFQARSLTEQPTVEMRREEE